MKPQVLAVIGVLASVLLADQGLAQGTVTGFVVDCSGRPIENVRYRISGYSPFMSERQMVRVLESGRAFPSRQEATDSKTDKEGRFVITWYRHPLVELQFRHPAYAPAFVYKISPADSPLKVVMEEGKLLKGRILDENGAPIGHAVLELRMPQPDVWYQEFGSTDQNGQFQFRISQPPQDGSWVLCYAGRSFRVGYGQIRPDTMIEFQANVQMNLRAEPDGAANRSRLVRPETNPTSAAAASPRSP